MLTRAEPSLALVPPLPERFLDGKVSLYCGDCLDILAAIPESSVDSCVTDPPYHLTSIVRRFGATAAGGGSKIEQDAGEGRTPYGRSAAGFMGKTWDGGDIAFRPETWARVFRALKPGAHLLAFGGTRTYHRMACAIEDAGFEIRDCVQWLYGSGFPKSHDVSKGIDRAAGAERDKIVTGAAVKRMIPGADQNKSGWEKSDGREYVPGVEIPATDAAREWQGWGTALKPACELIVLARKPLSEGTVAANVLRWGTGAINIDGCRVELDGDYKSKPNGRPSQTGLDDNYIPALANKADTVGRWPANVIHDGSDEVLEAFPDAPGAQFGVGPQYGDKDTVNVYGDYGPRGRMDPRNDSGSAARFFYTAKADDHDRIGSHHPTVKPLDLMQYLVRMVTRKGGIVIDPFSGTGTTGEAAFREGCNAILIEREAEYQAEIRRRMQHVLSGPGERSRAGAKHKTRSKPIDHGPLFGNAKEGT